MDAAIANVHPVYDRIGVSARCSVMTLPHITAMWLAEVLQTTTSAGEVPAPSPVQERPAGNVRKQSVTQTAAPSLASAYGRTFRCAKF